MLTVMIILAVSALISTVVSIAGKCPLFVPVLLSAVFECLQVIPKG